MKSRVTHASVFVLHDFGNCWKILVGRSLEDVNICDNYSLFNELEGSGLDTWSNVCDARDDLFADVRKSAAG